MADKKDPKPQRPIASTLEEFRYIQQVYQNQYLALAQEITARTEQLADLDRALRTLESLDKIDGSGALIPIASGAYINGRITGHDSAIIGVGAGFFIEKKIDAAKAFISKAVERDTEQVNRVGKQRKEIEAALIEIAYKIEELSH